jgi:hypothetical protein
LRPVPPDLCQHEGRDQHEFPEDEEQDQVHRGEHADRSGLEGQDGHQVRLGLMPHRCPRRQQDDDDQQGGQRHEQDAHPVHGEVVAHAHRLHPRHLFRELEVGDPASEGRRENQRQGEYGTCASERDAAHGDLVADEPEDGHGHDRQEDQCGEDREADLLGC